MRPEGSRWSARSEARTNDLDASGEWRSIDQVVGVGTWGAVVIAPRSLSHERLREGQARLPRHVFVESLDMVRSGPTGWAQSLSRLRRLEEAGVLPDYELASGVSERHAALVSARQRISPSRSP